MDINWLIGAVTVGALSFIWWDIRRSRIMNEKKLKKALYKDDGITVYVPRAECKDEHETFCKKTEEIKKIIAEMNEKREQARKQDAVKWEAINRTLGAIEKYMEIHT